MQEADIQTLFNQAKKKRGETFARLLYNEQILDVPNILHILEFSGNNPNEIKILAKIIRAKYKTKDTIVYHTDKTPLELLGDAGYDAFVVKNLKQQNSIKKYFRPGEELCTFRDKDRYKDYYMIHAIKRGAENIQPAVHPQREDEYGTSVISIQIAKEGGFISIKNRYNHHVNNPDATFNNNPDNIIHGLSESLKKYFNVDFTLSDQELPDNFQMVNDQIVRYNYEADNVYFGSNYYFSGNSVTKINKDYEIMMDCGILNTRTGHFKHITSGDSSLIEIFEDIFRSKKISIKINPEKNQERMIFANGVHHATVENGIITELYLPETTKIPNTLLWYNKSLKKFYAPKAESIGYNFLCNNTDLTELDLPSLKKISNGFLINNVNLNKFNAPNLEEVGNSFLRENLGLTELNLPSLKKVGDHFMTSNKKLKKFDAPNLESIGCDFLEYNEALIKLRLPSLIQCTYDFLRNNKILKIFEAPKLGSVGMDFLTYNADLEELNLPNLTEARSYFLTYNKKLKRFNAPQLETVHDNFLPDNTALTELILPSLKKLGDYFLTRNENLKRFNAPKLEKIRNNFLESNKSLTELDLPSLLYAGSYFLSNNIILQKFNAPNLHNVGEKFLFNNNALLKLDLPSLEEAGPNFLNNNECLQKFSAIHLMFISLGFLAHNKNLHEIITLNHPATIMSADDYKHLCLVMAKNNLKIKINTEPNNMLIPQRSMTD